MTSLTSRPPAAQRATLEPGSRWFIATLAGCMAATALAIDTALPAFPELRTAFGLADDATSITGVITAFFLGSSLGLLPAGLLADRFGRKAVMWGGLALYIAGAIASIFAPSLTVLFVARFVWGLGSAGPRVAAMAMVRDAYEGEQMAKQMSLIMAIFILVPTFAPALAAGVLLLGPWQAVFWMCVIVAVVIAAMVSLLPETLAVDDRRPLAVGDVGRSLRLVVGTPGSVAYLAALSALFGTFLSYLASSEIILEQVFELGEWFPLFFGGVAMVLGGAVLINSRYVELLGLQRIIQVGLAGLVVSAVLLLTLSLATGGTPPFWPFTIALAAVLFFTQLVMPNLNAAAMRPLGRVAGSAAALFGMIPGVIGAIVGGAIDRQFDGTVTPMSVAFVVLSVVAIVAWRRAAAVTPPPPGLGS